MTGEHLIPLTSEKAQKIGKIGGSVKSDAKKYGLLQSKSHKAMCKNCKAICLLKERNIAESKNHKCVIPLARAKAIWFKMPVLSEEVLDKLDGDTLIRLQGKCQTPKDLKLLHDAIMNKKRIDYPKIQEMRIEQRTIVWDFKKLQELYEKVHGV